MPDCITLLRPSSAALQTGIKRSQTKRRLRKPQKRQYSSHRSVHEKKKKVKEEKTPELFCS
jgi:hypothetical protein